jgi:hypothetical protein
MIEAGAATGYEERHRVRCREGDIRFCRAMLAVGYKPIRPLDLPTTAKPVDVEKLRRLSRKTARQPMAEKLAREVADQREVGIRKLLDPQGCHQKTVRAARDELVWRLRIDLAMPARDVAEFIGFATIKGVWGCFNRHRERLNSGVR